MIFDCNCPKALPLNKKSLDYCCSSDDVEGTFQRVYKGYRFEEPHNKKKKRLDYIEKEYSINFFMDPEGGQLDMDES